MTFLSVEELVNLKHTDPNKVLYQGRALTIKASNIDKASAEKILADDLERTLNRRQASKTNRPWEIVNLTDKLDPNQPWLGFEYEMGLKNNEDYQALVNHVWHSYNHVAFDLEGFGEYCPEVTFPPQNLEEYVVGTSHIQRTIEWMNKNHVKMLDFSGRYVGTHLNLSTPAYRNASAAVREHVNYIINHSLLMLNDDEMRQMFGRMLYGVGNTMESWIEYKMFNSTDSIVKFNDYIAVSTRMAEVMESLTKLISSTKTAIKHSDDTIFIDNLLEILSKKTPASEMKFRVIKGLALGGCRGWRYLHGTYAIHKKDGVEYAINA